jgi:hypothetical protein
MDLRQENSRLRHENREREKYWKAFVHARKSAHDAIVPPDSYGTHIAYRPSPSQSYDNLASTSFVDQHIPFDDVDASAASDRAAKYAPYPYSIPDSPRDPRWQLPALNGAGPSMPQSQSPSYMQSPSLTAPADLYPARFPTNDRKVDAVLSNAPYVFPSSSRYQDSIPNSRSMSPTTSASSATSLPLTSSYQLPFQDPSTAQDHSDFDYRSQSLSHCPDVTLHGGIADLALAGQHPDSVRYRFTKRPDSDANNDPPVLPQNDSTPQQESETTRARGNRRNIAHPYRRSQSPGPTPLSSTVAVIKAQAFGALRRTRAKTKKTADSAARVAQDVLEARGIGVGPMPSPKRVRDDDVGNG